MNLYNRRLNRSIRINNQFMNYKDLVVRFGSNVERDWIIDCGYGFLEGGLIRFKKNGYKLIKELDVMKDYFIHNYSLIWFSCSWEL